MLDVIDYEFGISAVDSCYLRPRLGTIHLIVEAGRAAIVDTGVNSSVPHVLDALRAKGIAPDAVDYVILTHIHLDHAGGAGLLMSQLPNAKLTVHPRGARHMIDPGKLVASALLVYGAETMERTYGNIVPIAQERVIETPHGSSINLNGREFTFYDTPGHARHHVVAHDAKSGHLFSGDTFGMSYREFDTDGRQFVFPSSSPTQFDPEAAHRSLDLIVGLKPGAIYVTHYSQVHEIARLADDMHRLVDAHAQLALSERSSGAARYDRLLAGVTDIAMNEARRYGWRLGRQEVLDVLGMDIELNAQGLVIWLDAMKSA